MTYFIQIPGSAPDTTTYVAASGDRIKVSDPAQLKTHPWFAFSDEGTARTALKQAITAIRNKPATTMSDVAYQLRLLVRLNEATIIPIA
jgi:hypothetical protein